MLVNFTKMQSLGNDFVMIDLITQPAKLHTAHIKRIADRHLGVGCDQIITLEPPIRRESNFFYRIFNANGHEAEQCVNGARCAAKFALDSGLVTNTKIYADCLSGRMSLFVMGKNYISMSVGKPKFIKLNKIITVEDKQLEIHTVNVGNPHIVCFVSDIKTFPVKKIGYTLSTSNIFPQGANVSFIQIVNDSTIKMRVFERGVGETLACGSAASAAAAVCYKLEILKNNKIEVKFLLGKLDVTLNNNKIYLAGPSTSVFSGQFRI